MKMRWRCDLVLEEEMKINVSSGKTLGKVTQYWTKCVGSCHAALALREDWRSQLKTCKEEFRFEYVRFHGLFDDDMSVCLRNDNGILEYSFFNVDSIFDFLLGIGMKPFIELSFMPEALASGTKTVFHYRGNITPPKSYEEWGNLCGALASHLVDRYGAAEVRKWFFEVWNEPNLDMFWAGTMEEYFLLYQSAALAIKKADSKLAVGGPSTAINAWIPETREFCAKNNLPLDFISTHHYPTDAGFGIGLSMEDQMARAERGVCHTTLVKAVEEAGPFPLYYSEWNSSPSPRDRFHDTSYCAAFIVKTVMNNLGLIECYSFWTFSDIFEECGLSSVPFHGGFGMLNIHGIPKPSYRAFQLLAHLNGDRLEATGEQDSPTVDYAASTNGNSVTILLSNHHVLRAPIAEEPISLFVKGIQSVRTAYVERIDEAHANPKKAWAEMGSPTYLNREQIEFLTAKSELAREPVEWTQGDGGVTLELLIQPQSAVAVTLVLED
jgi:xylan 1,4-beta-xylosidase